jgi:hypothetical protein
MSSSTFGCRKNGSPNRNDGLNPMPVSAASPDPAEVRGRLSREYVKCASFTIRVESVVNQLRFITLIRAGSPSMPLADGP